MLALDTTSARGSVAVVEGEELLGEVRLRSEASHSRRLLPAVSYLLDSLGLPLREIEGYAVVSGPGSFTGLRIGLSTVQGLALGHAAPCLGICALDVLAARMRGAARRLVAVMNAYRGEVYAGIYDEAAAPLEGPLLVAPSGLCGRLEAVETAFLGDGVPICREAVEQALAQARFPERSLFLAGTLGRLAAPRLAAGEGHEPARLRPLYVREADAVAARAR